MQALAVAQGGDDGRVRTTVLARVVGADMLGSQVVRIATPATACAGDLSRPDVQSQVCACVHVRWCMILCAWCMLFCVRVDV